MAMDGAASKAFVDTLYRKVLLAVKASNAVPTEDDDFHYHAKFSNAFAAHVASSGATAEQLVWQLTRVDKKRKAGDADNSDDSDDDNDNDSADAAGAHKRQELFDGPEPKSRITDFVDALLDDATKQLELFQRGETAAASSSASSAAVTSASTSALRPLENKPQSFDTKQLDAADNKTTTSSVSASRYSRGMPKPQDQFDDPIDNSDAPFASKLREKVHALPAAAAVADDDVDAMDLSDADMLQRQHPYFAEIKALKYTEWQLAAVDDDAAAYKQLPVEDASYLWVDSPETLAVMMQALTRPGTKAIAVDLEHHSYRSYLGLVCLMQISTATEDFLVDTLALRSQLQILNTVFCDPSVVKVLHGADSDILWLQRDLGLYVVNLFDTGQAARLLAYPRFSLAYLLKRHCNVDADKQYQLADWRVRPLDRLMVKYAREDTRYLLFIYDRLKRELLAASAESRSSLLFETLTNSSAVSLQVYSKPRVSDADCDALSAKLRATLGLPVLSPLERRVFSLLYYWRDAVARREDESTAYVLPNQALMKLAQHAPTKSEQLFRVCNPVPALVRKFAHELTSQISAVRAQVAAEDAKAAVGESATAVPAPVKTSTHWRARSDGDAIVSATPSSYLSAYSAWQRGKRSATCVASTESAAAATVGLRASFATLSTAGNSAVDSKSAATLAQVNALVARTAFTVSENDAVDAAGAAVAPAAAPAASAAVVTPHADALPQSIAETYQMANRMKRRKTDVDALPAVDATTASEAATGTVATSSGFEAFDYSAASEQVAGAKFDMADATRANDRTGGKKKRGVKQSAGAYNPFVAVRNAAGSAGDAPPDELHGAKKAVKKMHHMPRSATFR